HLRKGVVGDESFACEPRPEGGGGLVVVAELTGGHALPASVDEPSADVDGLHGVRGGDALRFKESEEVADFESVVFQGFGREVSREHTFLPQGEEFLQFSAFRCVE
ncbi:MAG: hypothetical protein NZ749_14570, partial [bacterium]|nr:hypothetical protein [bacterium]